MNNEIFTICYDSLSVYKNKTDAIKFYNNCYMMCEGAERERYASILFDLNNNNNIATDNVSKDCRDIYIHTNNYYDRPLKVNLLDKLSINEGINYYKNNVLPILEVCNDESVRFDCRIPFEDYGADRDINMRSITDFYSKLLNKRNVDFKDIYTNEICDGKYELKINNDLSLKLEAWDDFDIVVDNINTIDEYTKRKEREPEYE